MLRWFVAWFGVCMLVGCAGVELATVNPSGINLSGTYLVDFSASDPLPDLQPGSRSSSRKPVSPGREAMRMLNGSGLAFIAQDFHVIKADKISIEQNRDSMGIRYEPGVYRDVSWGEKQRGLWAVYAGWQDETLVIISTAKDLRVEERLRREGQQLVVDILMEADGEKATLTRIFRYRG